MPVVTPGVDVVGVHGVARVRVWGERDYRPIISNDQLRIPPRRPERHRRLAEQRRSEPRELFDAPTSRVREPRIHERCCVFLQVASGGLLINVAR